MAAFPARSREAHMAHWRRRILDDVTVMTKTILFRGEVVGNVVSWEHEGKRNIGYWIGRAYWGWGIATEAVRQFLDLVAQRPLYAHVAKHNVGSIRVLEKCGFILLGDENPISAHDEIEEILMELSA